MVQGLPEGGKFFADRAADGGSREAGFAITLMRLLPRVVTHTNRELS